MGLLQGDQVEVKSLTKAGVVFLVYLFIVIVLYFFLSVPINSIYDAFEAGSWSLAESQKAGYMPLIRTATTVFFAVLISIPVTWFFFWVFHREPSYQQMDYRNWRY